jgi:hypothetical protein
MKIFGKTICYWKEMLGGLILGIVTCIIVFFCNPHLSSWKESLKNFSTIGLCIFGFLLTILSLILQGNSSTIEWMKSRTHLYNRFILYNKQVVILSFVLSIYSYIFGYFNFQNITIFLNNINQHILQVGGRLTVSVFGGLFVWLIVDSLNFLKIFYILIIKKNDIL